MAAKKHSPLVHFVGIGGIGISALARWFLAKNWAVSGSDIAESQILQAIRKEGVKAKIGHKKGNLPRNAVLVIHNPAIPANNPELLEAKRRGILVMPHVVVIGGLTEDYQAICVAGSHGKSTTTAILGLILTVAKYDPTVIIGTNLKEFDNGNFRHGRSKWLVLESDEWNKSFLNYHPAIAVVTNIDKEHLDTYKNLANVKRTFLKFLSQTKTGGTLVLNRDDRNLRSLRSSVERIARRGKRKVIWFSTRSSNSRTDSKLIRDVLKIPGEHNLSNALAAYTVATKALKVKKSVALRAIGQYHGAWRRMEYRGRCQVSGVRCQVYDDYAHHPTEIQATLKAFKEKFSKNALVCVFQPHQTKRLGTLFNNFIDAFADADALILLPVYEVAGRDKTSSSFTSERLAAAIKKKYPNNEIHYFKNPKNIKIFLKKTLTAQRYPLSPVALYPKSYILNPIVIMMGAGDIVNYTRLLLEY